MINNYVGLQYEDFLITYPEGVRTSKIVRTIYIPDLKLFFTSEGAVFKQEMDVDVERLKATRNAKVVQIPNHLAYNIVKLAKRTLKFEEQKIKYKKTITQAQNSISIFFLNSNL